MEQKIFIGKVIINIKKFTRLANFKFKFSAQMF